MKKYKFSTLTNSAPSQQTNAVKRQVNTATVHSVQYKFTYVKRKILRLNQFLRL